MACATASARRSRCCRRAAAWTRASPTPTCRAATDFDISQVVDLVKGVHARIRKADFDAIDRDRPPTA